MFQEALDNSFKWIKIMSFSLKQNAISFSQKRHQIKIVTDFLNPIIMQQNVEIITN